MPKRITMSAARVAVSRPGYDVDTAPHTSDYMAVDSTFGPPLRLLQAGTRTASIVGFGTVSYGTTYARWPYVFVLPYSGGVINNLFMKWVHGSTHADLYFQPYNVQMQKDSFTISRADGAEGATDDAYYNLVRNWLYLVFPPTP